MIRLLASHAAMHAYKAQQQSAAAAAAWTPLTSPIVLSSTVSSTAASNACWPPTLLMISLRGILSCLNPFRGPTTSLHSNTQHSYICQIPRFSRWAASALRLVKAFDSMSGCRTEPCTASEQAPSCLQLLLLLQSSCYTSLKTATDCSLL